MSGFGGSVKLTGESTYRKALKQITLDLKEVDSELKVVASQYAKNDKSQEALTAKSEALAKKLETQAKKVETLKASYQALSKSAEDNKEKHAALGKELENAVKELERIEKESGKDSAAYKLQAGAVANLTADYNASLKAIDSQEAALSKARIEINNAQTAYNQTGNALSDLNEEIEKTADGAGELGDEVKTSGDLAKKAANGGYTIFKNILANLATIAIKQVATGLKKISEGFVNTGKEAFNAYAEYEQLVGGVETLFGKSAKTLEKYANEAYKTAGLSANSYMESVTSFSSALIKSLGGDTQKAVEYADKAIKDMSDNANKFGTSIDTIQSVYSALARNTYTTLDNLKLGFAGTKQGAEDLVKEAEKLDKSFKAQRDSSGKLKLAYSDLIDSIHIVQTNMGITGATAAEANSTIEGSANAMKAAWQNLLVSLASDNKDMSKSVKAFTDSVETYAKNAIPRVKKLVENMFKAGKDLIKKNMPEFSKKVLPVIEKVGKVLKEVATFVIKNFKTVATVVLSAAAAFATFNAVMAVAKTINSVNTALAGLNATVGVATKVQIGYNAALAANPIGAVLTAISLLMVAVIGLSSAEEEATEIDRERAEALDDLKDSVYSSADSWKTLKDAQQQQIDAGMSELSYYENLWNELKEITDANGKVKDGYEERADFIITKLNEAFDLEIKKSGDIIENMQGIAGAIDYLIKKKKAEIILNSQEALYAEALEKQADGYRNLKKLEDEINGVRQERNDLETQYSDLWEEAFDDAVKHGTNVISSAYQEQLDAIQANINAKENETIELWGAYKEQEDLVKNYAYNIALYEQNMELAHAGEYDKMSQITWNYISDYQDAENAQKAMLEDQITDTQTKLDVLKGLRDQYNTDIYNAQIEATEKELAEQQKKLKEYERNEEIAQTKVTDLWKTGLDNQVLELDNHKVEFRDKGNGLVDVYIDGWRRFKDVAVDEAAALAKEQVDVLNGKAGEFNQAGKQDGQNFVGGFNNGASDSELKSKVYASLDSFGRECLKKFQNALKEHSPSKATEEDAKNLFLGFDNGVKKNKQNTLDNVQDAARDIIDTFNGEMSGGANFKGLTAGLNEELKATNPALSAGGIQGAATLINAGSDRAITGGFDYKTMVSAFKDALSQVNIELDDQKVGKFVTKTVTQAIYY